MKKKSNKKGEKRAEKCISKKSGLMSIEVAERIQALDQSKTDTNVVNYKIKDVETCIVSDNTLG